MNKTKNHPHEILSPAGVAALIQDQLNRNGMKRVLKGLILAVAVVSLHHSAIAAQGGTDILHLTSKTDMVNAGVDPNAHGRIEEDLKVQGKADNQRLRISLAKLDPNTAYQLVAFLGDETNATSVAEFTTDRKGSFAVVYAKKSQGHQSPGLNPLPDALNPMCNVRELSVLNVNTQAVLRGILTSPDRGQYLVKRTMHNTGFQTAAAGNLQIIATSRLTQFRLRASHLSPSTDYQLMINGNLARTYTSDTAGRLNLKRLPVGSPNALHIQTLALTDDTGTNVVLISGGLGIPCTTAAQAAMSLGTAAGFGVLAGSTVANTGLTTLRGNLGVSPGSAVTGFPPGVVIGTQHVADTAAARAQLDLTTAYNAAAGRTVGAVLVAGNLGGLTLVSGLYKSTSSLEISSGDLTLDAQGDANGIFIIQVASTLTTTAGRQVILIGGAKAANVFWQVGTSATLGTTSVFQGTIMADQSITLNTGATLNGRALARIGAVTMDSNTITIPAL